MPTRQNCNKRMMEGVVNRLTGFKKGKLALKTRKLK